MQMLLEVVQTILAEGSLNAEQKMSLVMGAFEVAKEEIKASNSLKLRALEIQAAGER